MQSSKKHKSPVPKTAVCNRLVAAAAIVTLAQLSSNAIAGTTGSAITVSVSGSTALKNWFTGASANFTNIQPGTTLNINGTTYPTTGSSEWAINGGNAFVYQLAPSKYGNGTIGEGNIADYAPAVRLEYHESGSVEGVLELANDQVAPVSYITQNVDRDPYIGIGNAVWVNYTQFGGKGKNNWNSVTGGDTSATASDNYHLGNFYNNGTTGFNGIAQPLFNSSGGNINGGQNAVQLALSDSIPKQVFAAPTSGTLSSTPWTLTPDNANYGQGNTKLVAANLGTPNSRQVYLSTSALNYTPGTTSPTGTHFTGTGATAGLANLQSQTVASAATLFVANPGTGLTQINRTDAQWLQTTGRLANGASFNVTTRDVNSGTRNVAALETGIDPTWAVGVNDNGNGNAGDGGTNQITIGSGLRFSNKTAGGNELRPTVQAARMAVGTLSINDSSGNTASNNANPLRALSYSDTVAGQTANYVRPNYYTIAGVTDSTNNPSGQQYTIFQNEQFVTLKAPDSAYSSASPNILGDTPNGDVKNLINNTLNSVTSYQGSTGIAASPAAGLIAQGYIIPQLMKVQKAQNGLSNASASAITPNPAYNSSFASVAGFSTLVSKLNMGDPVTVKSGSSSSLYGASTAAAGGVTGFNGQINITSTSAGAGNYLFGNFNQTGVRDFNSVVVQAQIAQAALESSAGSSAFNGSANSTVVTTGVSALDSMTNQVGGTGATKGDLIVLGDYNSDGKFDGQDLYLMAVGASLTDSSSRPVENSPSSFNTSSATITATVDTFGQKITSSVLNKNVALDYLKANSTSAQKLSARAVLTAPAAGMASLYAGSTAVGTDSVTGYPTYTYDSAGTNAFNKSDVNQDGVVDFNDALAVDALNGKSFSNLSDTLTSIIPAPVTGLPIQPNLVLVQQIDTATSISSADLAVVSNALASASKTNWYGYATTKTGPGTINWTSPASTVNVITGASLQISSGSVHVTSAIDPFTDNNTNAPANLGDTSKSLAVTVTTGATLQYTGASTTGIQVDRLSSLNVSGGSVVVDAATNTAHRSVLVAGSLSSTSGSLDLNNNDLIVKGASSLPAVQSLLAWGYSNGSWTGSGIKSTSASTDASHLTALGVATSTGAIFDGVPTTSGDVLVKYTYLGDANLDGKVDGSDYSKIDSGYISGATGWVNGDFNYDGVINGSDYTLIDNVYNNQGATLASAIANPTVQVASQIAGSAGTSVPEPTAISLIGLGALGLLGRRRK